jgi:hypothetical protein
MTITESTFTLNWNDIIGGTKSLLQSILAFGILYAVGSPHQSDSRYNCLGKHQY